MKPLMLHHKTILPKNAMTHMVQSLVPTRRPKCLHGHSFYELLWVQSGTVWQHRGKKRDTLTQGDMVFLRPQDVHALQGRGYAPLVTSVTIHPKLIRALGNRHAFDGYFWSAKKSPSCVHLTPQQLDHVTQSAAQLGKSNATALDAEAFLLPTFAMLDAQRTAMPADAPDWLRDAVEALDNPVVFRDGAAGFVAATGRTHAHVSRSTRKYLGDTPSGLVNRMRMDHAARRLDQTKDSLADIAAEVGIPNLSHFHKLFRAHFGTTPRSYRLDRQRDVIAPDA